MWPVFFILVFTLFSGLGDAYGFTHATNIWHNGRWQWAELARSCLGFQVGFAFYWLAVRYMKEFGIEAVEVQTIFWFGITIISVAVVNGRFGSWQRVDQLVAIGVLLGIGWLLFRTGG